MMLIPPRITLLALGRFALLLMAPLLFGLAHADDASFVGDGATVFASQQKGIRMTRENIRIDFDPTDKVRRPWKADCVFEFENTTDQPIALQMGFPNWRGFGDEIDSREFAIKDFTTVIGGKPVPTQLKPIDPKAPAAPWRVKGKIATFDGAFVWPVRFGPHEKITVHNRFSFGGFFSNGPFDVLRHMPPTYPKLRASDPFWAGQKPRKNANDFGNAMVGSMGYIMTTAQTWDGPIGEATITITLPQWLQENPHFMLPKPAGYTLTRNTVSWHFSNYRPRSEIALYFITRVFVPESLNEAPPQGFATSAQARGWLRFSAPSQVAPEVIERLIAISPSPAAKNILKKALLAQAKHPKP